MRAPKSSFAGFESQRLERNRDLNFESGFVNDAFGFHQQVDAEVFTASFTDDAVALNAEWIEEDLEGFTFVVERVEHEADVVVLKNVVALRDCRADFVGFVGGFECDVEKLRIEADENFGWF